MLIFWDLLGTLVFCISGAIAGRQKGMDWFGLFVLALVTGTGGGTLRSVLLGLHPVPILQDPTYLVLAVVASALAIFLSSLIDRIRRIVSIIDAIGPGVFVCTGVRIALDQGLAPWAAVVIGVISASFGGVIRDIARAEIPLIFRREIYATACALGGVLYWLLDYLQIPSPITTLITILTVTFIRLLSIRYALNNSE